MIVEFENDPLVLIKNYQTENNNNPSELAQVLIGAVHVEFLVHQIVCVSSRVQTPKKSRFGENINALFANEIIAAEEQENLLEIKNTRNRFAHEINARLGYPMEQFVELVILILIKHCSTYTLEKQSNSSQSN